MDEREQPATWAERLADLTSCDISDACDELQLPAVRTGVLRPAWPGCPPLVGPVGTIVLETAPADDGPALEAMLQAVAELAGRIAFVDVAGRDDVQGWGSILGIAANSFGVLGALVNGAVRDVEGLEREHVATYARGVHPTRMNGRVRFARSGVPVHLDGQTVLPGAIAVADGNGTVFVGAPDAPAAFDLARELATRERERLAEVRAGADIRQVFRPRSERG